jgi:transposase
VRDVRLWARLLGVERAVIENVGYDEDDDVVVVAVRPRRGARRRCGICQQRCPGFDQGQGRRRWRALDLGSVRAFVEADAPRVECPAHGVVVAAVGWARHGAGHTLAFDDTAAWLATHTSKSAVGQLLRVAWRTVGAIVTRVVADAEQAGDRLGGLRRIGIDEISYKRGHRYLTVVVDHDSGRLLWAAPGRNDATLERFFDLLGAERCAQLRLVSADAADWIGRVVAARCPTARLCTDPFHVVAWATDALDVVRREVWNTARRTGQTTLARELKGARFALWRNPEDLTGRQRGKLAWIASVNHRLYRAWLLKEELRLVFKLKGARATVLLEAWLRWARRCRIPAFVELARKITRHRPGIQAALTEQLSNARVESINTKIRLLTRVAFGFRSPDALIALAMLNLGGLCPPLPGRA